MSKKYGQNHAEFHADCQACRRLKMGCEILGEDPAITLEMLRPRRWWVPVDLEHEELKHDETLRTKQRMAPLLRVLPQRQVDSFNAFLASQEFIHHGLIKACAGDFKGALNQFQKASDADPRNLGVRCDIIRVYLELGNRDMAMQLCDDLIPRIIAALEPNVQSEMPAELGLEGGHDQEALLMMCDALAGICLELDEFAKCCQICKRVLELAPEQGWIWMRIGIAEFALNHLPAAIEAFELAIPAFPHTSEVWIYIGLVKRSNGDLRGGVLAFQQATRVTPGDFSAWLNLADTHKLLGDTGKAEKAYRKALNIDPGNILIKTRLTRLNEINDTPLNKSETENRNPQKIREENRGNEGSMACISIDNLIDLCFKDGLR